MRAGTMTKKRRNSGRNKPAGARGNVRRVRCEQSGVLVPKDEAIKRFIVRNIVDASAVRDIQDASALEGGMLSSVTPYSFHIFGQTQPYPVSPNSPNSQHSLCEPAVTK